MAMRGKTVSKSGGHTKHFEGAGRARMECTNADSRGLAAISPTFGQRTKKHEIVKREDERNHGGRHG